MAGFEWLPPALGGSGFGPSPSPFAPGGGTPIPLPGGGTSWEDVLLAGVQGLGGYFIERERNKRARDDTKRRVNGGGQLLYPWQTTPPKSPYKTPPGAQLTPRQPRGGLKKLAKQRAKLEKRLAKMAGGVQPRAPKGWTPVSDAPYVKQADWESLLPLLPGAGDQLMQLFGRTPSVGGTVIADDLSDFYTDTGRARSTVASIAGDRITFWTNRGTPVLFSRDKTHCRRIRKQAGEAYRAAGGSSRKR